MKEKTSIKGIHTFTLRDAETGEITWQKTVENLITTAGRAIFSERLAGGTTYSGEVTHGALGSSSTAPTNGDTQLGAELANGRVAISSNTYADNVAYLSFFFPAGNELTYEEFGTFVDGTASADTGVLFTHVLISGVKSATETLTVDTNYTIS